MRSINYQYFNTINYFNIDNKLKNWVILQGFLGVTGTLYVIVYCGQFGQIRGTIKNTYT